MGGRLDSLGARLWAGGFIIPQPEAFGHSPILLNYVITPTHLEKIRTLISYKWWKNYKTPNQKMIQLVIQNQSFTPIREFHTVVLPAYQKNFLDRLYKSLRRCLPRILENISGRSIQPVVVLGANQSLIPLDEVPTDNSYRQITAIEREN